MGPNCVAAQQAETAFVGRKFKISHTSQTSGHFRNNFAPSQLNKLRLARSGWCEHSCRKRQFSKSLIFPITYYTNRVFWRFFFLSHLIISSSLQPLFVLFQLIQNCTLIKNCFVYDFLSWYFHDLILFFKCMFEEFSQTCGINKYQISGVCIWLEIITDYDLRLCVENSLFCRYKVCKVHSRIALVKCISVKINRKTLCSAKNIIGAIMICG